MARLRTSAVLPILIAWGAIAASIHRQRDRRFMSSGIGRIHSYTSVEIPAAASPIKHHGLDRREPDAEKQRLADYT